MAGLINVRRELVQTITAGWLVGAFVGTSVAFICCNLGSGLLLIVMLPLVLAIAALASMLVFVPGLLLVTLFPRSVIQHRALWFGGLPVAVALMIWTRGGFQRDLMVSPMYALFDAAVAGWWCYHFTGHLSDQA